jgi:transcriptional regulator with XRE-family HTH domain
MSIGKRLRELRLARSISVAHLEEGTRMPQGRIAAVEEGREMPTLDALEAWAGALGVDMHELFLRGELTPPERQDGIDKLSAGEKRLVRLFRSLPKADQGNMVFIGRKMAGLEPKERRS